MHSCLLIICKPITSIVCDIVFVRIAFPHIYTRISHKHNVFNSMRPTCTQTQVYLVSYIYVHLGKSWSHISKLLCNLSFCIHKSKACLFAFIFYFYFSLDRAIHMLAKVKIYLFTVFIHLLWLRGTNVDPIYHYKLGSTWPSLVNQVIHKSCKIFTKDLSLALLEKVAFKFQFCKKFPIFPN